MNNSKKKYEIQAGDILKEKKAPLDDLKKEKWVLGVAESGRGQVLGPMVFAACFWPKCYDEIIKKIICNYQQLSKAQMDQKYVLMNELNGEMLKFECTIVSAEFMSINQLSFTPHNLNVISHETTIQLIKNVLSHGYNIKECYINTVGPKLRYKEYLETYLNVDGYKINVTVEEKADTKFQIVTLASICANVTRDNQISEIQKSMPDKNIGNGSCGDPKTQSFINQNIIPVFGYPNIVRFSWQTIPTAMAKQDLEIEYYEEKNIIPAEDLKQEIFKTQKVSVLKYRMLYSQQVFL